ncbi:hypothetical protein CEE45_08395 [Candidatus Heimdallarchaeota archaeon B3_Heim]|nr:MAG: hypothetical protein CEE45_08395 [Candidatus Heimdallarchaeota archaeon B3_Heim]
MSEFKEWSNQEINDLTKMKNVTIRGIDSEIYDEFSSSIKSLKMNIGEAITQMMQDVLKDFDDTFPNLSAKGSLGKLKKDRLSISALDKIRISRRDLEEAGAEIRFTHVGKLIFEPDVDLATFNKYVRGITHCEYVRIPAFLPKLILLSKTQYCGRVETYQADKSLDETTESFQDSYEEE